MSTLRAAIFAKARERGLADDETELLLKRVEEALEQFVGQPKTRELALRVAVVGTAVIDQAFAEIESNRKEKPAP